MMVVENAVAVLHVSPKSLPSVQWLWDLVSVKATQ